LVETLRHLVRGADNRRGDINPYLYVAWQIRDNMPLAPSIDNFLDTHRHDEKLVEFGKIAICHAIQKAESKSRLVVDKSNTENSLDFEALGDTWLLKLFKILVAQRTFEDFLEALQNITFVSFNYDRCIHQFFWYASRSYFRLEQVDQDSVLSALSVLYPYGTIGDFKKERAIHSNFGVEMYGEQLLGNAKSIKTFTEGADSKLVEQIKEAIGNSELVLFLGFGFLRLNMELLFEGALFPALRVLGTGKGLSQDSISEIQKELLSEFPFAADEFLDQDNANRVRIVDCTCGSLFHEYERYLSR